MIRAVVCDFGGVLTTPMGESFQGFAAEVGITLEELGTAVTTVEQRDGAHPLFELECGRISEPEFMRRIAEVLAEQTGREVSLAEFSARLWEGLSANEPMVELMTELRATGYRMALLTNNVKEWAPLWRALVPVDDIFEVVVDSAFVGMRKPDPRIYEITGERLGVPLEECLFVDDFAINCDAARELGMTAVQFVDSDQAVPEIRAALNGAGSGFSGPGAS